MKGDRKINISEVAEIILLCHRVIDHPTALMHLALRLDMHVEDLALLLVANHQLDAAWQPLDGATGQDILNVIVLYYALSKVTQFKATRYPFGRNPNHPPR